MKLPDFASTDKTILVGATIGVASLLLLAVGLYSVIGALTDDPANLPSEGDIDDILADSDPGAGGQVYVDPDATIPQGPKPTRLGVPGLFIDAPVEPTGFEPGTNQPDVPNRADLVSWYNFTPTPGMGSNAVFSGHVDWQTPDGAPIPGVFYRLRELKIGDSVSVTLDDGRVLEYRVTGNIASSYDDPNLLRLMASTKKDVVTLITCGGSWVPDGSEDTGGNYSHRVLVRAELVPAPAAAAR
jgi:LPXTG-site transpeptidase (sortase) family protein